MGRLWLVGELDFKLALAGLLLFVKQGAERSGDVGHVTNSVHYSSDTSLGYTIQSMGVTTV